MKKLSLLFGFVALSIFAIGCGKTATNNPGSAKGTTEVDPHAGHDHAEEGHEGHDHAANEHAASHGGHLIELGKNHEYHAELVDDHKTESITIYMMDADMKPLTVNQSSVSLVLTSGETTQTFEVMGSQPGGSAEFKSSDQKLMEMMESKDAKGKLRVTIDGKPFSGEFEHLEHGHEGEAADSHAGHDH